MSGYGEVGRIGDRRRRAVGARVARRLRRFGPTVKRGLAIIAVLTMIAATFATGTPQASAATTTVVAQANWNGLPLGTSWPPNGSAASMPGDPAMTVSLSTSTWKVGETVRVTATLRSGVAKQTTVDSPDDHPSYNHSGASGLELALNGQFNAVGWGSSVPQLDMSQRSGGVRFQYVEQVRPPGEKNYLFGPGDTFWIDYVATVASSQVSYPMITGWVSAFRYDVDFVPQRELQSMTVWQVLPYVLPDLDLTPTAAFSFLPDDSDQRKVQFSNESKPAENGDTLTYKWTFGDGTESTEASPTHTFPHAGTFTVRLGVTDQNGRGDYVDHDVVIPPTLIVNSKGDKPAVDPTERGCDTGEVVGPNLDPECTLRAAIETINLSGEGRIVFDLTGEGSPTVDLDSPLPATTGTVTIDGTTQEGGWVGIAATGASALTATDGRLRVRGLTIWGSDSAVVLAGGENHSIKGNRLHTFLGGTMPDVTTGYAVRVDNTDHVVLADNLIKGKLGVRIGNDALSTSIHDNQIGDDPNGNFRVTDAAILTGGPSTSIVDNLISGQIVGVILDGSTVVNSTVMGNQIIGLEGPTSEGVRANGTEKVQIANNQISGWGAGVVISGSDQTTPSDDGISRDLNFDYENPLPGDSVGGSAEVANNTINASHVGVVAWAGALATSLEGNTVTAPTSVLINGARAFSATGNTFLFLTEGIAAANSDGPFIEKNTFRSTVTTPTTGIRNWQSSPGAGTTTVQRNSFEGVSTAVTTTTESATIAGNTITGASRQGIVASGANSSIELNTVVGGGDGIVVEGPNTTVNRNWVGIRDKDSVIGNSGDGVVVDADNVTLTENLIVGSGKNGVRMSSDSQGTILRLNRIWSSGLEPIADKTAVKPPEITGVFRRGSGESARTTLVMKGVSADAGPAGIVDIFANDSCSDGEARYFVTSKEYKAGVPYLVVTVPGVEFDHFTVVATPKGSGESTIIHSCASFEESRDADGDGSADQLEALIDSQDDSRTGVLLTEKDELMFLHLFGNVGRLENVVVGPDPAPNSHPAGWDLRYGAIGFRVVGIEPGSLVRVDLQMAKGEEDFGPFLSYWKYGVPPAGGSPKWFEFPYDEVSGIGARGGTTLDGRSAFGLFLRDGQTGDYDGVANGTITDPGGPVMYTGGQPEEPSTTVPPVTTPTTVPTSVPPTTVGQQVLDSTATQPAAKAVTDVRSGAAERSAGQSPEAKSTVSKADKLSYTGGNSALVVLLGLTLISVGSVVLYSERRRAQRRLG